HRPGGGRLADRVAGRLLLGAVALDRTGWKPEDVLGMLGSGPIRDPVRGGAVPVAAWSTAVVAAGCRGNPGTWQARLEGLGGVLGGQRHGAWASGEGELGRSEDADGGPSPWGPETAARTLGEVVGDRAAAIQVVRDVRAFVDWLAAWVAEEPQGSWRAWSRWCRELLQGLLGDGGAVETWPAEEREARESVLAVLDELGGLDRIEPGPAPAVVRTALAEALAAPAPSTTRAGRGLLVAPLTAAVGLPLEAVAVVGLTDGVVPGPVQPDGLLAVAPREILGSLGERAQRRRDAQRRALAWVVRSCPDVLLTTSRSDPSGGAAEPSAWWEQPPGVPDPGEAVEVPSHPVLVAEPGPALDPNDARQRSLVRWRLAGRSLATHPLAPPGSEHGRRAALEVIPADALPEGWPHRPLAPSALADFCACPQRFFLERVLGLEAMAAPVGPEGLDGRGRGWLAHRVLQEVGEWMRRQDGEPTDEELEERVRAVVDREASVAAGWLGAGGLLWELDLCDLADQLVEAVRADARRRARAQVRVVAVEQALGGPGGVAVPLPGGHQLVLRGRADRIDRLADGRLWVEDYKTGQADRFKKLSPGALAKAGGVQLCAYLTATEVTTGEAVAGGAYQFVVGDDPGRRLPLAWDEEAREEATEVLGALAEALASGAFPQRRGADRGDGQGQCPRCPVAAACPPDRRDAWEEAESLPGFRRLVALLEETEPSDLEKDETR
ncbi:PD-(D/E)XK nuclease family protein, partial [Aciditerrimonas ferrireducens]